MTKEMVQDDQPLTLGQRSADKIASLMGSWKFIICQTTFLAIWITLNIIGVFPWKWDVYPFVFLNLMLSFQAAYSAPFIMMSQNRQSDIDRKREQRDLEIDEKAEEEIRDIQEHLHWNDTELAKVSEKLDQLLSAFKKYEITCLSVEAKDPMGFEQLLSDLQNNKQ